MRREAAEKPKPKKNNLDTISGICKETHKGYSFFQTEATKKNMAILDFAKQYLKEYQREQRKVEREAKKRKKEAAGDIQETVRDAQETPAGSGEEAAGEIPKYIQTELDTVEEAIRECEISISDIDKAQAMRAYYELAKAHRLSEKEKLKEIYTNG